jgi:Ser/Thr protein kinase RdoA (MazF antagonist)
MGLALADGRQVVLKVRPWSPRLTGCLSVQRHLWQAGFPCPEPLAGPAPLEQNAATAEVFIAGRGQLTECPDSAERFAAVLEWLLRLAPHPGDLPSLRPSLPWVGWDHDGQMLWPALDDRGADLNAVAGPRWLDHAAHQVRDFLLGLRLPAVVGHGDFESQNVRWRGSELLCVDDWDSVVAQPEPAIVGAAAAVWAARGHPGKASNLHQTQRFLDGYVTATGQRRDEQWYHAAWAAGLWIRLYNAKKDAVDGGGPQLDLLALDYRSRLNAAGLGQR